MISEREIQGQRFRDIIGSKNGLIPFAAITGAKKEMREGVLVKKVILGINEMVV
ncbi:MAG: hypothetical protein Q7K55_01740 [Candidatus Levybacteria bacterium]|nr:hypothetical protein [Candidatus Levybacteria bacterium]